MGVENVEFEHIVEYKTKTYDEQQAEYHCKLENRNCQEIKKVK